MFNIWISASSLMNGNHETLMQIEYKKTFIDFNLKDSEFVFPNAGGIMSREDAIALRNYLDGALSYENNME